MTIDPTQPERSPSTNRGANGKSVALLVIAIVGITVGGAFIGIGSLAASQPTTLENLDSSGATLGAAIRDQIVGTIILMLGMISFFMWLAVGAIRREL